MSRKSLRVLVAVGAGSLLFLIAACGGGSNSSNEAITGGSDVTEIQPSPASSPSAEEASASPAASPSEEAPSPSPTGFAALVVDGQLTNKGICSSYKKSLVAFQKNADRRVKGAAGKTKDSYDAARFRKYNQWVKVDHEQKLAESLEALAVDALNEVSNGQAGSVSDLDEYLDASIDACGLSETRSKAEASVAKATSTGQAIVTKANSKPWYPKGYNEWFGGDIAWKWTDESCGTRYGYCWTIRIVSDSGCYGGVYAEVNISQGGTIIGWSNDSLGSLPAGKTGKMEFTEYGGSGTKTANLTELNCR